MMVSLAGLQRIVFTPPSKIMDFEFSKDSTPIQRLAPHSTLIVTKPTADEEHEMISQRFHLAKELFWSVFSGIEFSNHRGPTESLMSLASSLEFHFEDGQNLSLVGVYRKIGLPLFLNPYFYLTDASCSWEKALETRAEDLMKYLKLNSQQKKNKEFQKTWIVILEILAWAFQRQRQVGDLQVQFCDLGSENFYSPRSAYAMQDLEFLNPLPVVATFRAVVQRGNTAQIKLWQGYENTAPENQSLRIYSSSAIYDIEQFFSDNNTKVAGTEDVLADTEEEKDLLLKKAPQLRWKSCFSTTESGEKTLLNSVAKIEHVLGADNMFFMNHQLISADAFTPLLKIREDDSSLLMGIAFEIESAAIKLLNFPSSLKNSMQPFYGGLDHFFKFDRKDIASRHQQFRSHDLLFLRHQGLTLFCLFELINWITLRPLSSGEKIDFVGNRSTKEFDVQFEKVLHYLQSSIPALLGKALIPFQELVSLKVKSLFVDFVEKLFDSLMQDRILLFEGHQIIEVKDVQAKVLPQIRFLILHFIESSQGRFLTKSQAPLGERFVAQLALWTEPTVVKNEVADYQKQMVWMDIGRFDKYLIALLFELSDAGVDVELNGIPLLGHENPFNFVFAVSENSQSQDSNWFDLHPQIFFNGTRVMPEEVKINFGQGDVGFIEYQGQLYRIDKKQMPSLKSLQKFWNKIKGNKDIQQRNSFGEKIYRLDRSQALELLMLKAQGVDVQGEGEWKRIFEYFEKGLGTDRIQLPEGMLEKLLPHQLEGAQWLHDLYELKLGAILADEMGLGKTFQVLAFLISLQTRKKLKKCLIVVPTSLVYNWLDEKKKFAPQLPFVIFQSAEKEKIAEELKNNEPLILITTYGLLNENPDFFQAEDWNVLAFDEAQNLKNITSLRSVSARKLKAQFKISITGTPMENNYVEYFSLCDLIVPGCLGDIDSFRREYFNKPVTTEALKSLKLITKPLLLRRSKQQVQLSLPEKTVEKVFLPFGPEQKEIYMKMAMTFSRQVEALIQDQGERKAQIAMFSALMRLRQICSDPAAVPGVVYHEQPAKIEHFLESLKDHLENQESVIVFTQFLSTLGRIEKELKQLKVPTFTLQGSVSSKERIRLISAFQNSAEPGVMLMTLKTGGVGLNLTKASVVYHLEPWWNPAVENQATDRAHRMGQTKSVKVFNLLIEGSLEERIADLKLKKQASFDRLFGNDEQVNDSGFEGSSGLTKEDFFYLLK